MRSFVKALDTRRPRVPSRCAAPGSFHQERCNPDGPSQLEQGDVRGMDLRTVVGLRAALDDAIFAVAQRFNLKYQVLRGRFGADGAMYEIGLEVKKPDRAMTLAK